MSTIASIGHIENEHSLYCEEACMSVLFKRKRKNITDFLTLKRKNVTDNKKRIKITSRGKKKCSVYRKNLIRKFAKDKNHRKGRDHCLYTGKTRDAEHSFCSLRFNSPMVIILLLKN